MIKTLTPAGMTNDAFAAAIAVRPTQIMTSNGKLRKDGISNVTMPAYRGAYVSAGQLKEVITCPQAGQCKGYCYASSGTYGFSNSMIKHGRNLNFLMNDAFGFADQLTQEVIKSSKRPNFRAIRWNDSGDVFSEGYWGVMKVVMKANPGIRFYAYSKRISFWKAKQASGEVPANMTVVFSFGGTEDHLIDTEKDRHAMVFPSRTALRAAGYSDGTNTDRLASNPRYNKIGLVIHGNWLALPKLRRMSAKINAARKQQVA